MEDYYDRKYRRSHLSYKMCFYSFIGIVVMFIIMLLCGCKTWKTGVNEEKDTHDSVQIEVREIVKEVPVTVYVEIPAQQKERETKDSVSYLKTDFAESLARLSWVGEEPLLFHSLSNIPQRIEKTDSVQVKETVKTVFKTRRVTYNKTIIKEKRIAWWQKALMYSGVLMWLGVIILILIRFLRR